MAEENLKIRITADGQQAIKELQKVGKEINNSEKMPKFTIDFNEHREAVKSFSEFFQNRNKHLKEFTKNLSDVGSKMEDVFGGILKTVAGAVTAVGGAISMVAKNALAIGGGFESSMTSVKIISGATAEELEELTAKAREMGATMPITAKNAADAMVILAQRGTKAGNILKTVTDVASLAISQGVDMASASDLLGSTMQNFGMGIEEATRVTNLFNNASNQSALNMSKLRDALKYAAPAASAVGYSLDETLAALEILANAGLTGMMSGTGLAMVLSKLAKNARVAGVETKTLDGNLRPLKDIFKDLAEKGFTLADASRIFGERGAKAALNLAKSAGDLEAYEKNLNKMGATAYAVEEKMKTFPNVLNAFKSAKEELQIEIFEQIKEKSKSAVGSIAELTREFSKWVHQTNIAGKSLDAFINGLGFKIPNASNLKSFLSSFNIDAITEKIKSFGATLRSIGDGIATAFNVIKTPLLFLINHLETFTKISFWGWILGKGLQVPAAILGISNSILGLASSLKILTGANLLTSLGSLVGLLSKLALPVAVVGGISYGISEYIDYIQKRHEFHGELIKFEQLDKKVSSEISKNLITNFEDLSNLNIGFDVIPKEFENATSQMQKTLKQNVIVFQNLKDDLMEAISVVNSTLDDTSEKFEGSANNISDNFYNKITSILNGDFKEFKTLPDYWQKVTEKLLEVGTTAKQVNQNVHDFIKSYRELKKEAVDADFIDIGEGLTTKSNFEYWKEDLESALKIITVDFPDRLKYIKDFVGEQDLQLNIDVQLEEAKKKLKEFTKTTAEKYNLPKGVINNAIFREFEKLANKGDKAAKAMTESLKGSKENLSNFLLTSKETATFWNRDLNDALKIVTEEFSARIEYLKQFLSEQDLQLAFEIQLDEAENKLKEFAKVTAKKFNLPESIVDNAILEKLNQLAVAGNKTAQSLVAGWKGAKDKLTEFLGTSEDAIKYLHESPSKFMPALKQLFNNIQRIDPITGKLTEKFKKAYDVLNSWNDITFNQLTNNLQALEKAYKDGFISKEAYDKQFKELSKRITEQVKIKVATELEPTRNSYRDKSTYEGVIASKYFTQIGEIGGAAMLEQAKKEFNNPSDWNRVGEIILKQISSGIEKSAPSIKINGIEQLSNISAKPGGFTFEEVTKPITDAFNPLITKLEQVSEKSFKLNGVEQYPKIDGITQAINSKLEQVSGKSETSKEFAQTISKIDEVKQSSIALVNNVSLIINAIENVKNSIVTGTGEINKSVIALGNVKNQPVEIPIDSIKQAIIDGFSPFISQLNEKQPEINQQVQFSTDFVSQLVDSIISVENAIKSQNIEVSSPSQANIIAAIQDVTSYILSSSAEINKSVIELGNKINPQVNFSLDFNEIISAISNSSNEINKSIIDGFSNSTTALENAIKNSSSDENLSSLIKELEQIFKTGNENNSEVDFTPFTEKIVNAVTSVENAIKARNDTSNGFDETTFARSISAGILPLTSAIEQKLNVNLSPQQNGQIFARLLEATLNPSKKIDNKEVSQVVFPVNDIKQAIIDGFSSINTLDETAISQAINNGFNPIIDKIDNVISFIKSQDNEKAINVNIPDINVSFDEKLFSQPIIDAIKSLIISNSDVRETVNNPEIVDNTPTIIAAIEKLNSSVENISLDATNISQAISTELSPLIDKINNVKTDNTDLQLTSLVDGLNAFADRFEKIVNTPIQSDIKLNDISVSLDDKAISQAFTPFITQIENITKTPLQLALDENALSQAVSNGFNSIGDKFDFQQIQPEQINLSQVINAIQNTITSIENVRNSVLDNTGIFSEIRDVIKSQENISFNENAISQAVISGFNPLASRLEQQQSSIQNLFGDVIKSITAVENAIKSQNNSAFDEKIIAQSVVNGVTPLVNGFEQQQNANQSLFSEINRSILSVGDIIKSQNNSSFNETAITQAVVSGLNPLITKLEQQQSYFNEINKSVLSVENAIKSQNNNSASIDSNSINQAVVNGFNPLIAKLEQQQSFIQNLSDRIDNLRKVTEDNTSTLKSGNNDNNEVDLTPLVNSAQNLSSIMQNFLNSNASNLNNVKNAVNSLENSVKSLKSGNNYDIDIHQQGFVIQQKSDADKLARAAFNALKSGFGNGGV